VQFLVEIVHLFDEMEVSSAKSFVTSVLASAGAYVTLKIGPTIAG